LFFVEWDDKEDGNEAVQQWEMVGRLEKLKYSDEVN
jgi:hypothetical protein